MHYRQHSSSEGKPTLERAHSRTSTSSDTERKRKISRQMSRQMSRQLSKQKSVEEEQVLMKKKGMSQLVQEEKAESGNVCE